jgi:pyrimidine operon attenuation protein/uracil phosphoribosyltransferase
MQQNSPAGKGSAPEPRRLLDGPAIQRALARIGHEIVEREPDLSRVAFIGLPTRGFPLAQRLAAQLEKLAGTSIPVGQMDITFHRDDLELRTPIPHLTNIPFDITEKVIVLVDDVLFTGRSVRAALNALNDFGRPAAIRLVALIDRGHRQLPIRPDFVGKNLPTAPTEQVAVKVSEIDGTDSVEILP